MNIFHKSMDLLKKPVIFHTYNQIRGVHPADKITSHIWLGNIQASHDIHFLKENKISVIVNCTQNEPFHPYFQSLPKIRVDVSDHRNEENIEKFYQQLPSTVQFIQNQVKNNQNVLIHCYWGFMRSATVVAAYLMKEYQMNPNQVIPLIQEKRPQTFGSIYNFNELLFRFYEENIL
jgi:dual specificity phosphatase 12